MNLSELLSTWQAWNARDVTEQAARRAETDGRDEDADELRRGLARDAGAPSAIEALAAHHELAELLAGWRWHTITAAREQGASWDDVAAVTGVDPATARDAFRERLAQAEQAAEQLDITFGDADRYRAAARDDTDDLPARHERSAGTGEETTAMTDHEDQRIEHISGPEMFEDGLVEGEIALPGGLPPDEDDNAHNDDDVPRWEDAVEIADRDGYVVFDPAAPGGFRALTAGERAQLHDAADANQSATHPGALDQQYAATQDDLQAQARALEEQQGDQLSDAYRAAEVLELARRQEAGYLDLDEEYIGPRGAAELDAQLTARVRAAPDAFCDTDFAGRLTDNPPAASDENSGVDTATSSSELEEYRSEQSRHGEPPGPETDAGPERRARWAVENADSANAVDDSHPDDRDRLEQRLDELRVRLTGYTWREGVDRDVALADRRAQLGRWYDADHADQHADSASETGTGEDDDGILPHCLIYPDDPEWSE